MDTQPVSDGNGGPPTLAVAGVVKYRCASCHAEMTLERAVRYPQCACGQIMILTAATGETIEQAIAAAAQELPERVEPVQQTLPGTRPAFDVAGALDMIEEAAQLAADAETAYTFAHETAKAKRKIADALNEKLRDLIRDLAERRHDARYETHEVPAVRSGDGLADHGHEADALSGVSADGGGADDSQLPVAEPADQTATSTLTGRAHVINATLDGCAVCGIGFTPYPEHKAGDPFGMNCHGYPEDRPEWLQERLADAGAANITLDQIALWTPEQRCTARLWAEEQIEAHAKDEPGKRTSIAWPEHVSLAHHGPEIGTHTPTKRKKTTRRRSR